MHNKKFDMAGENTNCTGAVGGVGFIEMMTRSGKNRYMFTRTPTRKQDRVQGGQRGRLVCSCQQMPSVTQALTRRRQLVDGRSRPRGETTPRPVEIASSKAP